MTTSRGPTTWLISVALLTFGLAGCTGTAPEPTPTPTPTSAASTADPNPSPTPSVDPALAEAEGLVLEAYRGYWAAKVASYADPSQQQDPSLAVYAIDTALTDAQAAIASMRADGIVVPGEPVIDPEVTELDLATSRATLADCIDTANWQGIFSATGESAVAPDQFTRVTASATAAVYEGRWVIDSYHVYRDQTC